MSTTEEKTETTRRGADNRNARRIPGSPEQVSPPKKKMTGEVKLFIAILVGAMISGGAAIGPTLLQQKPPAFRGPENMGKRPNQSGISGPIGRTCQGNPKAKFTLVEFSDFQCPSCKNAVPEVEKPLKAQHGKLNLVFRHFQAARKHMHSRDLGIAAEAAGVQGKFYEMGDKLFDHQPDYEAATSEEVDAIIMKAANDLKLDAGRFKKDRASAAIAARYDADQAAAEKANLNATPTFFFVPPTGPPIKLPTITDATYWANESEEL